MQELEGQELAGRQWWKELEAIMPAEQGAVLYFKKEQVILENYSPAMVVNQLARRLGVDVGAMRRRLRTLLGRRMVPLPLLPNLTLVPLPVRKGPGPLWGHVVFERAVLYRRVKEEPFRSAVYLDDGTVILTLLAPGTLRRVWREAIIAKKEERRHYLLPQPPDSQLNEPWPARPYISFPHRATGQETSS